LFCVKKQTSLTNQFRRACHTTTTTSLVVSNPINKSTKTNLVHCYFLGRSGQQQQHNDNDAHDAPQKTKSKRSLVIWDCDGVLVDSEALLKQGEVEALSAG
jgi:hypothetical protein